MKKLLTTTLLSTILISPLFAAGPEDPLYTKVTMDTLELQNNEEKALSWDANVWIGHDINKLYLYSEGEKPKDESVGSETQLVYSRAIASYWDVQFGVGYDKTDVADKTWGVVALSGLAPYFFETRAALLVGDDGNIGLRVDLEYEALLTQKLILTPSLESEFYSKDAQDIGLGKGLSSLVLGARLRYEIRREFAPYIGVEWSKNFGNTEKFSAVDEVYAVAGVRFWF
jgi:copper resistance protein B